MEFTSLGSTGTRVSRICLGAMSFGSGSEWMISEQDSFAIVKKALDAGINFFDTANAYSRGESEQILGKALRHHGANRDELVVATKVYLPMGEGPNLRGLSRKNIMQSIDASLKRLGMDYVDLFQIHRFDNSTPIEETIEALHDVVKAGKALYLGASSMYAYQFAKYLLTADRMGKARFQTMQNQYSLLYREEEREMNPLCVEEGVGLIPWSPLAGGVLARTGTEEARSVRRGGDHYRRPADLAVIEGVRRLAAQRGEKPAQVALAWMLAKPGVTAPIIGASKLSQLDDPIAAVSTKLSAEEIAELEAPYEAQAPSSLVRPRAQAANAAG
jgi:1-deoxyxylulose-5-phosphate synthase